MRKTLCPNSESSFSFTFPSPPFDRGLSFGLQRSARVRAPVGLLVALPRLAAPDLEAFGHSDHDHLRPQADLVAKPLGDHQPALGVELGGLGAAEEHAGVGPGLLARQWPG